MPDYSFIATPKVPEPLQTLSSIMNTANAAVNLQRGNVALEQERALLQPNILRGQSESERAAAEAKVSTQTADPRIAQATAESKRAEILKNLEQYRLTGTEAQIGRDATTALMQDPSVINGDANGILKSLAQQKQLMIDQGLDPMKAEVQYIHAANVASSDPKGFRNFLANTLNIGLGASGQAAQNFVPASSQQAAGGTLGPRELPAVVKTNRFGEKEVAPMPVRGVAQGPLVYPPNESPKTQPEVEAIRAQANTIGAAAPAQHFNNKQILDLSSDAFTGTGSGKLSAVLGAVGLQSTNNVSSDTAQLKHFIALQIEQNATAQGASTDAARNLAAQAVLPTDSPEKAIKSITKVNDAYVTGNELYNAGMEAAINNPNNQNGVFAARQFRNAWSANFDPRITLLENAQKSGDTETVDRILGKKGSPQRAAVIQQLLPKARALQALSKGQM